MTRTLSLALLAAIAAIVPAAARASVWTPPSLGTPLTVRTAVAADRTERFALVIGSNRTLDRNEAA